MATEGDAAANTVVCENHNDSQNSISNEGAIASSSTSVSSLVKGDSLSTGTKESEEWLGLPEDFTPSKMDVIVGWARQNYHHGTYE